MSQNGFSKLKPKNVIEAIRLGDEKTIEKLYLSLQPQFITWATPKFALNTADLSDCWQETIIAFYEQVVSGKLQNLDVELKTYLFAIGRNKALYKSRSQKAIIKKEQIFLERHPLEEVESNGYFGLDDLAEEQKQKLQKAMGSLSEKNRTILVSRYYHGLPLEKIKEQANYKSINAVSATLSRALTVLKKIVQREKNLLILLSFYLMG